MVNKKDNGEWSSNGCHDTPTVELRLEDLRPFPSQKTQFPRQTSEEINALSSDIEATGLQHPIEVRSDRKTIIAGHRRVEAVRKLGWITIPAVIRHDLEALGELAIEAYFIGDNFNRRQLTPLEKAHCAKRLLEIEAQRAGGGDQLSARELQCRVGDRLGIGDRQVRRLLRVLDAPPEVQTAYESGQLHIDAAGKVADLDTETQKIIAEEIAAGENPKQVVSWYVADGAVKRDGANHQFQKLIDVLAKTLEPLRDRIAELSVRGDRIDAQIAMLQRCNEVSLIIIERLHELKSDNERSVSDLSRQLPAKVGLLSARPATVPPSLDPDHDAG